MHLADLASYASAQSRVSDLYADARAGAQGDPQCRLVREVLQRSHDRGVCGIDLEGEALSRQLTATLLGRRIMAGPRLGRSRGLGWMALGIAVAPVVLPGCSPKTGAARTPPPPVVTVVEARRMTVPIMAEPIGTTRALQEVSIRARVRGFLKEIHFQEGAEVKKGQLLFVIDEEPFKAKLADAQAALEQAEAALKKAQDSKAREVAQAQLTVGRSMLALAEVEERREQLLYKRNASSVEDVQRKQAMRQKEAAQVEADKASLDQANADYETAIVAARADVDGAKARVTDARIDLSYCRMFSPIDGRIGLAKVKPGNLVGPATGGGSSDYTELGVVRQLDPMGVDIQVSSRYLDRVTRLIAQGLPVEVFRPGLEGEEARRLRRQGDRHRQHDRPVDLHLPGPGGGLQPGEVAPARRVREGRRQGGRGPGCGRRPRAGRDRDPGRSGGLYRRRAGQGGRHLRPGHLHLRGPARPRIGHRSPARA